MMEDEVEVEQQVEAEVEGQVEAEVAADVEAEVDEPAGTEEVIARKSERKRVKTPKAAMQRKKAKGNIENSSSESSKCVICYAVFKHCTAFSRKNHLSSAFCSNVILTFARFMDLDVKGKGRVFEEDIDWDFEAWPLPFCSTCCGKVLSWTKLQQQYEELQNTISTMRASVKSQLLDSIQAVVVTPEVGNEDFSAVNVKEEVEVAEPTEYDENIESLRKQILFDAKKTTGKKKEKIPVKPTEVILQFDETVQYSNEYENETLDHDNEQVYEPEESYFDSDGSESCRSEENCILRGKPPSSPPTRKASIQAKKINSKERMTTNRQENVKSKLKLEVITAEDGRKFFRDTEFTEIVEDGKTTYQCSICGSVQKSLIIFKRHVNQVHYRPEPFECILCGKVLQNMGSKSRHMKIYHSDTPRVLLECELCGKNVTSQRGMTIHKGLIHRQGLEKFHLCDICSRPFHNEKEMKSHRWSHKSEEEQLAAANETNDPLSIPTKHVCQQCGKVLSSDANLRSHELIHSSEKPFVCEVCGWAFRHKANLLKHLEIHMEGDETLRFVCKEPECGKKYRSRTQLRNHSYSHQAESSKPHKCLHCDTFFVRAMDLKVHKRIHTGEKPFQCEQCAKHFSRQHHWTRHMKNVHGVPNPGRPPKFQNEKETIITFEDFNYSLVEMDSVGVIIHTE